MFLKLLFNDREAYILEDKDLSVRMLVEKLKELISKYLKIDVNLQRLIFSGKQLKDGDLLFSYGIKHESAILVAPKQNIQITTSSTSVLNHHIFKVGDEVLARCQQDWSWKEAVILEVDNQVDKLNYQIKFTNTGEARLLPDKEVINRKLFHLPWHGVLWRTSMIVRIRFKDQINLYDAVVYKLESLRVDEDDYEKILKVQLCLGDHLSDPLQVEDLNDLYVMPDKRTNIIGYKEGQQIGPVVPKQVPDDVLTDPLEEVSEDENWEDQCEDCQKRTKKKNCKICGCRGCGRHKDPQHTLLCDDCDASWHIYCLQPPLETIPEDNWYCPDCFNDASEIAVAGQHKISKKMRESKSFQRGLKGRDWGKGMATASRKTICTSVGMNHVGKIPGIKVGSSWRFRIQCSEAGVHRPPVAGIHGQEKNGAFSIVLAGGYEDDHDEGEEFLYTGSGGRDFAGNKRVSEQSSDQKLEKNNKALAVTCDAALNAEIGAKARDWRKSKPIRVLRSYKAGKKKENRFAPKEGIRYDGIYKIVSYWPARGSSGFTVWRFKLRRDDPEPAPWTPEGIEYIRKYGLFMEEPSTAEGEKRKRKSDEDEDGENGKKMKYEVPKKILDLVECDTINAKMWKAVLDSAKDGYKKFFLSFEEAFKCGICLQLVVLPVTLKCGHNFCKVCLIQSIQSEVESCATCRCPFEKLIFTDEDINQNLSKLFKLIKE